MDSKSILALREQKGWTQEELARFLGLDRSTVSRMETGQPPSGPTLKLLEQLAATSEPPAPQSSHAAS